MRKSCSGFTLVELIVAIAASVLVVAAASSFMLFGMRMEKASSEDAALQSDSRIILRVLENIAAEMVVMGVEHTDTYTDGEGKEHYESWELYATSEVGKVEEAGKKGECVLSYDKNDGAIKSKDGSIVVDKIASSTLEYENRVLKCEIETTSGEKYSASVYCRIGVRETVLAEVQSDDENDKIDAALKAILQALIDAEAADAAAKLEAEMPIRKIFLSTLLEQYGSTGKIYDDTIFSGYEFATWYWAKTMSDKEISENNPEDPYYAWKYAPDTVPWCALFVSWGLNKTVEENNGIHIQYVSPHVDSAMWFQFRRIPNQSIAIDKLNNGKYSAQYIEEYDEKVGTYACLGEWKYPYQEIKIDEVTTQKVEWFPNPGDVVFFENVNNCKICTGGCENSEHQSADHMGVVLYVMPETPIYENNVQIGISPATIYTIEGNNDDRVGVFSYTYDSSSDAYKSGSSYIIGYGVIDWAGLGLAEDVTSN